MKLIADIISGIVSLFNFGIEAYKLWKKERDERSVEAARASLEGAKSDEDRKKALAEYEKNLPNGGRD
jgi:hypothetical protein